MNDVSLFRLYVLRAMYLFIVAGLGVYLWPGVLNPQKHWELREGMESCMLAAFSLLCLLGLRFPLQMLPESGNWSCEGGKPVGKPWKDHDQSKQKDKQNRCIPQKIGRKARRMDNRCQ